MIGIKQLFCILIPFFNVCVLIASLITTDWYHYMNNLGVTDIKGGLFKICHGYVCTFSFPKSSLWMSLQAFAVLSSISGVLLCIFCTFTLFSKRFNKYEIIPDLIATGMSFITAALSAAELHYEKKHERSFTFKGQTYKRQVHAAFYSVFIWFVTIFYMFCTVLAMKLKFPKKTNLITK